MRCFAKKVYPHLSVALTLCGPHLKPHLNIHLHHGHHFCLDIILNSTLAPTPRLRLRLRPRPRPRPFDDLPRRVRGLSCDGLHTVNFAVGGDLR